jgi:hypothetical protein
METLKGVLGTGSIEFDVGLLVEVPPRYDTIGSPDPACLCIRSTRRQRKIHLRESGCLFLAQGRGSLVFDLLVVCVAMADGRDVVAFRVQSVCCAASLSGPEMRRFALGSRTVPPAIAGSYPEACFAISEAAHGTGTSYRARGKAQKSLRRTFSRRRTHGNGEIEHNGAAEHLHGHRLASSHRGRRAAHGG